MSYLLALDQGTSSSRAIVFERSGRIVAMAQQEFAQHFPQPGWVEHDALEIWQSQLATAQAALRQADLRASDIAAVGITNQRETTVLWDRQTGQPLHHAIVWQDRRTEPFCAQLRAQDLTPMVRGQDRSSDRPLLFRHQAQVAARSHPRRACPGRTRRAGLRHHRQLADLESHSWRGARHRCQQCLAHPALRCAAESLGRGVAGPDGHSTRAAARGAPVEWRFRPRGGPAPGWRDRHRRPSPATSRRPCSAKPASSPAWPRTPTAPAASC